MSNLLIGADLEVPFLKCPKAGLTTESEKPSKRAEITEGIFPSSSIGNSVLYLVMTV